MTKKDYVLIVEAIWRSGYVKDKNKIRQEPKENMRKLIASDLTSSLANENPKFDRSKFLRACGF